MKRRSFIEKIAAGLGVGLAAKEVVSQEIETVRVPYMRVEGTEECEGVVTALTTTNVDEGWGNPNTDIIKRDISPTVIDLYKNHIESTCEALQNHGLIK